MSSVALWGALRVVQERTVVDWHLSHLFIPNNEFLNHNCVQVNFQVVIMTGKPCMICLTWLLIIQPESWKKKMECNAMGQVKYFLLLPSIPPDVIFNGPAQLHRCFHFSWLIRPLLRLKMGEICCWELHNVIIYYCYFMISNFFLKGKEKLFAVTGKLRWIIIITLWRYILQTSPFSVILKHQSTPQVKEGDA